MTFLGIMLLQSWITSTSAKSLAGNIISTFHCKARAMKHESSIIAGSVVEARAVAEILRHGVRNAMTLPASLDGIQQAKV